MNHEVQPTEDMALIKYFMTLPEIWERVAEDDLTKEEYQPNVNDQWLLFLIDNNIVGICEISAHTGVTLEMHPALLKKFRHYSRVATKSFIKWVVDNSQRAIKKFMLIIPKCFPTNKNGALKLGFKLEGINRQSFMKNKKLEDQWIFGLTEIELQECLT